MGLLGVEEGEILASATDDSNGSDADELTNWVDWLGGTTVVFGGFVKRIVLPNGESLKIVGSGGPSVIGFSVGSLKRGSCEDKSPGESPLE